MKQFSFGFQLGVQSYSEFIFFKRKEALDDFTKGRFKFSAQMPAVVAAAGASTDANYSKNVAVFTMVKGGLMYDVFVGGQKFSFKHAKPEDRRSFTWRVAVGTGSGFFVSPGGHILTNQHVIDECNRIVVRTIERDMEAFAVLEDPENDLALLKTTNHYPSHIAEFRSGKEIRVGDEVIAFGYPRGDYLGDSVKVTVGTVSALTGPGNDTKLYQITAPIQLGNSGGPLLDRSGNVVGIVSSSVDFISLARDTEWIPQYINFAIKSFLASTFLGLADVEYKLSESDENLERAEIAERAKNYTVRVECRR